MEYNEIKKLINDIGNVDFEEISLELPDGVKINMKKRQSENVNSSLANCSSTNEIKLEIKDSKSENEDCKIIKSPMVGTFYSSSSPNAQPFVKVGDRVKKGQVVCIVEAMKLMNEIESEWDGEVVEICTKNEAVVEYGTPLFKIKGE